MKNRTVVCLSILLLSLAACSTVQNVSDVELVSKNNFTERIRVDSIVLRDSIFIREKSDTVFYTKYRTVYREMLRVDTIVRCDTIFRDREVVVDRTVDGGNRKRRAATLVLAVLLPLFLWRTGLWYMMWNMVMKGITLCKRIFRLKV